MSAPRGEGAELRYAKTLCDRIEAYWQKCGYHGVRAWVGQRATSGEANKHRLGYYPIESNLDQCGYPPRKK